MEKHEVDNEPTDMDRDLGPAKELVKSIKESLLHRWLERHWIL